MSNLQDAVNILSGHSGEIELSNHLSLGGNKIKNVAAPTEPNDAVTSAAAEKSYSAAALRPHLESAGRFPLRTFLTALKGDVTASGPGVAQAKVVAVENFSQIGGNLTLSQLPTAGVSGTVPLAKLTGGGMNGSLTVQNGLITAIVNPT